MNKTDYILRSLAKTRNKRWEHYVITRIFHGLNDLEIEFVCQQCIRKSNGSIALVDLFFPQLDVYLEIDESHHDHDLNKIADAKRRFDIAQVTNFKEYRIPVSGVDLETINANTDEFIAEVRQRKAQLVETGDFSPWDFSSRYIATSHLERGYIEIGPDAAFRTHKDALNCFGYTKGHYQRAAWELPTKVRDAIGLKGKCIIWFPKLYKQEKWDNSLSQNGELITEINKSDETSYGDRWDKRIVMARSRDEMNRTLYRFLGVFEPIQEYRAGSERRFKRMDTRIPTYQA